MESRVDRFTSRFFWGGYAVFLLASIPHIAAYFRHFDPVEANGLANSFWWLIAYAIAIVIDLSDVLVSIAVIKAMKKNAGFGDVFGYWAFIVFIMALSWFFNWQYNVVYGTASFAAADAKSIFGLSVGTVNPIIGSAFQALLLVYTAMAHKFADKPGTSAPTKSLEELRAEAKESAERASLERQIAEAHTSTKVGILQKARVAVLGSEQLVTTTDTDSNETAPHAQPVEVQLEEESEAPTPVSNEREQVATEAMSVVENVVREEPITDPELDTMNVTSFPTQQSKTTVKLNDIPVVLDINNRRKPLTVSEAMSVLGVSEKT